MHFVNPPSQLLKTLKNDPEGTEFIVGSSFYLRKMPNSKEYEVWLTPDCCNFIIPITELQDSAKNIIENFLPHFIDVLLPTAYKKGGANHFKFKNLHPQIPFVMPDTTTQPIHAYCQLGEWAIFAGPYVLTPPAYGGPARYALLRDIDLKFIQTSLEIGYCCNQRPVLEPLYFSDYVVKNNEIAR